MNIQKHSDNFLAKTILPFISDKITPNQVTWVRIFSLPIIAYLLVEKIYLWAFIAFCISASTDAIDGALARKRNRVTERGKLLDPMADKMLIALVALIFIPQYFGWWLVVLIVALETLNVRLVALHRRKIGMNPGASWAGKTKMVMQCLAFIFIFLTAIYSSPFTLKAASVFLFSSLFFTILQCFIFPRVAR